ncbi:MULTISPECIES: PQQ-dependent sugar dehydrogenase [Nocardioides]|uniref:PQQ-dependent sugar dehydrogenase n=1 Tax=Nocardioides vastitatis TaxID=2568655 RepID=A0ABW0ZQ00_9ACTN|nr:PQQ-dependent sugar dehydrogenase [Nocardioides sp.]THI95378.1 PQQ-dependent sugar dehydrogenase [Nocardioides sp.]
MRSRVVVLPGAVLLVLLLAAAAPPGGSATPPVPIAAVVETRAAVGFRVDVVARGLDHPWEVQQLPNGRLLVTQRDRRALTLVNPATGGKRNLGFPSRRIWARGETGLLGLEIDPRFADNRRIYTCSGWRRADGSHDVRVIAWTLDRALTRARLVRTLVAGIPSSSIGRHAGCRLLISRSGDLLIGTGDATRGRTPQNLDSFGGKVLRVDRFSGRPHPRNRWYDGRGKRRYVLTYGHRNIQGLAQRADGSLWSVEHGTFRDDEVNRLGRGRNYGWHPVPGYNESRPMTDHRLPGRQFNARWRSGDPTIAPSGADFVTGAAWGAYRNSLAVAVLKDQRLMFVKFDADGRLRWTRAPAELRRFGRLRDVTATGGNALFVTTDNGDGRDVVLRVRPRP